MRVFECMRVCVSHWQFFNFFESGSYIFCNASASPRQVWRDSPVFISTRTPIDSRGSSWVMKRAFACRSVPRLPRPPPRHLAGSHSKHCKDVTASAPHSKPWALVGPRSTQRGPYVGKSRNASAFQVGPSGWLLSVREEGIGNCSGQQVLLLSGSRGDKDGQIRQEHICQGSGQGNILAGTEHNLRLQTYYFEPSAEVEVLGPTV